MIWIGVVSVRPYPALYLGRRYAAAVRRAGGVPVFLTWNEKSAAFWARRLDGFLFTGGGDPDPKYYGQERRPACGQPNPARDAFELALLKEVLALGKPILGVCRGEQMLNVAMGGTMVQDIPTQRPEAAGEVHDDEAHRFAPRQPCRVVPGTRLHELLGAEEITVNSIHHQAVDVPAPGLRVNAVSPAGIIEGVEAAPDDERFLLSVQWHPEATAARDPRQQALFDALVRACGNS